MFERFTDRARRAVTLAQTEARRLNHNYIGTEHILLGLIVEEGGVAARALAQADIALDTIRAKVEATVGRGKTPPGRRHIPFTPRAKRVMELSLREALSLGHNYIGTEHILLGLLQVEEGVGARILLELGVTQQDMRARAMSLLAGKVAAAGGGGAPIAVSGDEAIVCSFCGRESSPALRMIAGPDAYICAEDVERARGSLRLAAAEERCSFCARTELATVYERIDARICDRCVGLCEQILDEERPAGVVKTLASATGPDCPSCHAPLADAVRYRILPVAEQDGDGRAQVLFVFCSRCGRTIDSLIAPEEL